ncbi:hypothetical protein CPB84DRAFT_1745591 [Gymnopilus junonius]|uniref:Uncharacterized protein n=1 Tax=Gymnopilus junonius TaxID=109634 RepID=A0A9P5NSP3_GYMJU|nr:hypothetical protein CPB84DRAFT_1745591 [Gymnopilus junonius]
MRYGENGLVEAIQEVVRLPSLILLDVACLPFNFVQCWGSNIRHLALDGMETVELDLPDNIRTTDLNYRVYDRSDQRYPSMFNAQPSSAPLKPTCISNPSTSMQRNIDYKGDPTKLHQVLAKISETLKRKRELFRSIYLEGGWKTYELWHLPQAVRGKRDEETPILGRIVSSLRLLEELHIQFISIHYSSSEQLDCNSVDWAKHEVFHNLENSIWSWIAYLGGEDNRRGPNAGTTGPQAVRKTWYLSWIRQRETTFCPWIYFRLLHAEFRECGHPGQGVLVLHRSARACLEFRCFETHRDVNEFRALVKVAKSVEELRLHQIKAILDKSDFGRWFRLWRQISGLKFSCSTGERYWIVATRIMEALYQAFHAAMQLEFNAGLQREKIFSHLIGRNSMSACQGSHEMGSLKFGNRYLFRKDSESLAQDLVYGSQRQS